MAQQLFYFILFLNNNIIITSNKIMWGITAVAGRGQREGGLRSENLRM